MNFINFLLYFVILISIQTQQNYFEYGVQVIPHPEKADKGGEDAYYANNQILAVADGVGGWNLSGIDPSIYSKTLCQNLNEFYAKDQQKYKQNPKQLIIDIQPTVNYLGSSTLAVITIDEIENYIYTSYIGDSGYLILRYKDKTIETIFEFEEQQKRFNFPFQLGMEQNGDNPSLSAKFKHQIKHNDIIVLGSDGLFDNLDSEQIKGIVLQYGKSVINSKDAEQIAKNLAQKAFEYSLKEQYLSPFAKKAHSNQIYIIGGKSDDITIIVAQIKLINGDGEKKQDL